MALKCVIDTVLSFLFGHCEGNGSNVPGHSKRAQMCLARRAEKRNRYGCLEHISSSGEGAAKKVCSGPPCPEDPLEGPSNAFSPKPLPQQAPPHLPFPPPLLSLPPPIHLPPPPPPPPLAPPPPPQHRTPQHAPPEQKCSQPHKFYNPCNPHNLNCYIPSHQRLTPTKYHI